MTPQVSLVSKVIEYTQKLFGDEDEYKCCFRGSHDGDYGFLVFSNKRLMFLREKGLTADYDKRVDIPYESIRGYASPERNTINIDDHMGNTHTFRTSTSAMFVEKQLKDLNI